SPQSSHVTSRGAFFVRKGFHPSRRRRGAAAPPQRGQRSVTGGSGGGSSPLTDQPCHDHGPPATHFPRAGREGEGAASGSAMSPMSSTASRRRPSAWPKSGPLARATSPTS